MLLCVLLATGLAAGLPTAVAGKGHGEADADTTPSHLPDADSVNPCADPYNDCSETHCCKGGKDVHGAPNYVCSSLTAQGAGNGKPRCYSLSEISTLGDEHASTMQKFEATLNEQLAELTKASDRAPPSDLHALIVTLSILLCGAGACMTFLYKRLRKYKWALGERPEASILKHDQAKTLDVP